MKHLRFLGIGSVGVLFVHTVEDGHRLRLPLGTAEYAPWLKASPKATMTLGRHGGVQVWQHPSSQTAEFQGALEPLKSSPPKAEEAGSEWMRLLRYEITRCEVEFSAEPNRYSLVLPREFRLMEVLPDHPEAAAVVISGSIFEIWRADKWAAHAYETGGRIANVTERALVELEQRG
jgi:hypothetical protein